MNKQEEVFPQSCWEEEGCGGDDHLSVMGALEEAATQPAVLRSAVGRFSELDPSVTWMVRSCGTLKGCSCLE